MEVKSFRGFYLTFPTTTVPTLLVKEPIWGFCQLLSFSNLIIQPRTREVTIRLIHIRRPRIPGPGLHSLSNPQMFPLEWKEGTGFLHCAVTIFLHDAFRWHQYPISSQVFATNISIHFIHNNYDFDIYLMVILYFSHFFQHFLIGIHV